MNAARLSAFRNATHTFDAWKSVQDKVKPLQENLDAALLIHAEGGAPFPDKLSADVQLLRVSADELFCAAAEAFMSIPGRY